MGVIQLCAFLALCVSSSVLQSAYCKDCAPPPHVKDGLILAKWQKTYRDESTLTVACRESYEIQGDKEIDCHNGEWSPIPRCVEREKCGAPVAVEHATVVKQNQKEISYRCDEGYELNGNSKVTCNNGQWTASPVCSPVSCGSPPAVANAFLISQSTNKIEATYQCNHGYILTGPKKATCRNGQWTFQSEGLPTCLRTEGTQSNPEPIRPGQGCGSPPKINNGDVIENKRGKATYQCNRYFKLKDRNHATCQNGQWHDPPTCLPPCSIPPIPAEHNLQAPSQTNYIPQGETVYILCRARTYSPVMRRFHGTGSCKNGQMSYTGCIPY
ncbi:complement factor H-like isoform X1 [Brienomyrus brachyistius]|uniref:complement factor H-like isoform X1 n=1 Tax=Brienomyrus brachyistius TaxID=42636 RepID=UPI0020B1BB31|nr:complement factor H-like isoform X1 [Brienomyrus brachyistius]